MTIKDAIKQITDFYGADEEAPDAVRELEKMQDVGVDCEHCKYNGSNCNVCKECMFYWLAPSDQKKPLNYEPI